ncbi:MAG: DUF1552 domain-containing protein [Polyangiales bacterium]
MDRARLALSRRDLLKALLGGAAALPFASRMKSAHGDGGGRARRLVVFYFPDGVPGRSQDGQASLWDARMEGGDVALGEILAPLGMLRRECVFLNGLSMGSTDEGSHPGGAKKLLTARDGGNGESIDQYLARTVASDAPFRHLYLGAMATQNNASGDKFISYPSAGVTVAPEDDPLRAFSRVFSMGAVARPSPSEGDAGATTVDPSEDEALVLDNAIAEVRDLRGRLDDRARSKLDVHLDALTEVRGRVARVGPMPATDAGTTAPMASCDNPTLTFTHPGAAGLVAPENFPAILRAQIDVMVQAMACGLSRVGVIQGSQHTSELIMSRFRDTEMYDAGFDMRSHQASHYGARQDRSNRLFTDYLKQRRWWVTQFAYLLEQMRARPEGDGTMLDHSLVLLCSEVSDGNTHSHQDMPFVLAGRGGGCVTPGRVLDAGGRRHGDLLAAIARAMGADVNGWGDASSAALPGLLT